MAKTSKIPEGGFEDIDDTENWFRDQDKYTMIVFATRGVLRGIPTVQDHSFEEMKPLGGQSQSLAILNSFHNVALSLVVGLGFGKKRLSLYSIHRSLGAYTPADDISFAAIATDTRDVESVATPALEAHINAIYDIYAKTNHNDYGDFSTKDALFLEGRRSAIELLEQPLWPSANPNHIQKKWKNLRRNLLSVDQNWQVWTNWYEARLRGDPLNKELELARVTELSEEDWKQGPSHVNSKLQAIEDRFASQLTEHEVLPQTAGALHFNRNSAGKVDADPDAETSQLATDRDARDRHRECLRLGMVLREKTEPFESGSNANTELRGEVDLFLEAMGEGVEQVRPGLLIPRGEALRMEKAANKKRDQYSDLGPLSEEVKIAFDKWEPAYNQMVALDPVLARGDQASYGPDAKTILIAPDEGMQRVETAKEAGAATEGAVDALAEEAKVAPKVPDSENRNSRRFSEGAKNFERVMVASAVSAANWLQNNPKKATAVGVAGLIGGVAVAGVGVVAGGTFASAGGVYWFALRLLANEDWLLDHFADDKKMLDVIERTLVRLKTLPLK